MSAILQAIGSVLESVLSWITTSMSNVVSLFYDTSGTTPTFTFLGVLLLVGFGLSFVWVLINFIRGLVRRG